MDKVTFLQQFIAGANKHYEDAAYHAILGNPLELNRPCKRVIIRKGQSIGKSATILNYEYLGNSTDEAIIQYINDWDEICAKRGDILKELDNAMHKHAHDILSKASEIFATQLQPIVKRNSRQNKAN